MRSRGQHMRSHAASAHIHGCAHGRAACACAVLQFVYGNEQYAYFVSMFGHSEASSLVNAAGVVNGAVALPLFLGFGLLASGIPAAYTLVLLDLWALAFLGCVLVPNQTMQLVSAAFYALFQNVLFIVWPVFARLYAPPELFGTFLGVMQTTIGLFQTAFAPIESAVASLITTDTSAATRGLLVFWTVATVVIAAANFYAFQQHPPPSYGSVTMADIRR